MIRCARNRNRWQASRIARIWLFHLRSAARRAPGLVAALALITVPLARCFMLRRTLTFCAGGDRIHCRVVHSERLRDLLGFNRARNAVLEAAILASRTAFLPPGDILRQLDELQVLVDKTGAEAEHRAFSLLRDHVEEARRRQAAGNETR